MPFASRDMIFLNREIMVFMSEYYKPYMCGVFLRNIFGRKKKCELKDLGWIRKTWKIRQKFFVTLKTILNTNFQPYKDFRPNNILTSINSTKEGWLTGQFPKYMQIEVLQ